MNDEPLTEKWAPSEWGKDDKAGSVNRTTAAMVLKAIKLVKQGKVATLGKVYQSDMPMFGVRSWKLTIPGLPSSGPVPFGPRELVGNDEVVTSEIGQVGTQFDGPGHIGVRTSKGDFFYNGRMLAEVAGPYGVGPLGVEHVAQIGFVCRGVLLNAAAYRGMEQLPIPAPPPNKGDPGIITGEDIQAMVKRQGIEPIGEGDCVFLYTGHGNIWHPTKWDTFDAAEKKRRVAAFNKGEPGFGTSACKYLASRKIILTGGDSWAVEAVAPTFGGETPQPFECHLELMPKRGIWNLENLDLSKLVADNVSEFLFAWSPLKMKGATGSPGNPIALY
ncbi:MAG: cyclase family protein [Rhodospirillaceae bacterium]|nr:cyclase family protein [Rhodospirillaceae bacterium]MBT4486521.1 cyclase family protein [Rhodospirillaceae bacterium]MBT5895410.1 cyclase family protein [Rhodospirillaceae bacterium]MBT6428918.1 cyclase family protein [Rhodospirillaceae bacterium]MBT7758946.1 cyclase family protein [Rhodospirillaceae bacterium]